MSVARIDPDELSALQQHLRECDECRSAYADYISSLERESSQGSGARLLSWSPAEARRRRFLEAAEREGLKFSDEAIAAAASELPTQAPEVPRRRVAVRWQWVGAAGLAATIVAGIVFLRGPVAPDQGQLTQLMRENSALREELRQRQQPQSVPATITPDSGVVAELQRALTNVEAAGKRIESLERSLGESSAALTAARAEAAREAKDSEALRTKIRDIEERVATLDAERSRLIELRAADAAFIELQSAHNDRLSEELRDRNQQMARTQELLGADRDIRDLMGARNLHVIDVFDVDGRGKTRKSFGRAFYTEGKSLIFYAFDLNGREAQRASFQAWGHRAADERSTQSLGIFYSDDKAQNRWILKFDDPKVLAQIDAVFVTVEPPGGSARPSGQKLLYAYLRNNPNHP